VLVEADARIEQLFGHVQFVGVVRPVPVAQRQHSRQKAHEMVHLGRLYAATHLGDVQRATFPLGPRHQVGLDRVHLREWGGVRGEG